MVLCVSRRVERERDESSLLYPSFVFFVCVISSVSIILVEKEARTHHCLCVV